MSNWLEEEKERKRLNEIEEQKEKIRKEKITIQIATQIKRFKEHLSPFYSYINNVKSEGFPIKVVENSSGILIHNDSNDNYRSVNIKSSDNNSFFISITGTYHTQGYDYDSPIVEEVKYDDHSFTRETRKQKYVSYDYKDEICKIECEEDELLNFLNNEVNALEIIGWIFSKTKLRTKWFPGRIPKEIEYINKLNNGNIKFENARLKNIAIGAILFGLGASIFGYIIYYIFNSSTAFFWILFIGMFLGGFSRSAEVYRQDYGGGEINTKKFDFYF